MRQGLTGKGLTPSAGLGIGGEQERQSERSAEPASSLWHPHRVPRPSPTAVAGSAESLKSVIDIRPPRRRRRGGQGRQQVAGLLRAPIPESPLKTVGEPDALAQPLRGERGGSSGAPTCNATPLRPCCKAFTEPSRESSNAMAHAHAEAGSLMVVIVGGGGHVPGHRHYSSLATLHQQRGVVVRVALAGRRQHARK